jgi:small subunit ribosomal protein S16
MAVHIRLSRKGGKKDPFYRVVAADSQSPRDGRFIEHIGIYDPNTTPVQIKFDEPRLAHWLSVGAQPSATVSELIKKVRKEAAAAAKS